MKKSPRRYVWFLLGVAASCLFIRWNGRRNRPQRVGTLGESPNPSAQQAFSFGIESGSRQIVIKRAMHQQRGVGFETVATAPMPAGFSVEPMGLPFLVQKDVADSAVYFVLAHKSPPLPKPVIPPSPPPIYKPPRYSTPYQPIRQETRLCRITPGASKLEIVASSQYAVSSFAVAQDVAYWVDPQPETVIKTYPHDAGFATLPEPHGRLMVTDLHTLKSRTFHTLVPSRAQLQLTDDGICIQDGAGAGVHTRTWFYKPTMSGPVEVGFDCKPPLIAAGDWLYWTNQKYDGVRNAAQSYAPEGRILDVIAQRLDGTQRRAALSCRSNAGSVQQIVASQSQAYGLLSNIDGNAPGYYLYQVDPIHPANSRKLTDLPDFLNVDKISNGYLYYIARERHESADGGADEYVRYRYKLPTP